MVWGNANISTTPERAMSFILGVTRAGAPSSFQFPILYQICSPGVPSALPELPPCLHCRLRCRYHCRIQLVPLPLPAPRRCRGRCFEGGCAGAEEGGEPAQCFCADIGGSDRDIRRRLLSQVSEALLQPPCAKTLRFLVIQRLVP